MADGGYRRPELWLSDGWAAVQAAGQEAPLYWERDGAGWSVYTLYGPARLDPALPVVHVSYYEADAYARWRGARLPDRGRMGGRPRPAPPDRGPGRASCTPRRPGRQGGGLRQLYGSGLAVDVERLSALPGLPSRAGGGGGVQR